MKIINEVKNHLYSWQVLRMKASELGSGNSTMKRTLLQSKQIKASYILKFLLLEGELKCLVLQNLHVTVQNRSQSVFYELKILQYQ